MPTSTTTAPTKENLQHRRFKIETTIRTRLADTITPVTLYLKLRDQFSNTVLLESVEQSAESNFTYIGLDPIANFKVQNGEVDFMYPTGEELNIKLENPTDVSKLIQGFVKQFDVDAVKVNGAINGFFGHTSFDGVQYFDTLEFPQDKRKFDLPDINYWLHRFIIIINHFKDELYLLENIPEGQESQIEKVKNIIDQPVFATYNFELDGAETSNLKDEEFRELVRIGKKHCQVGDVFQIVFARQFQQRFKGDEFQVYRVLRSINPSPYLFYFDCGSYKIFGSSPEAQMIIKGDVATVNPIAGTYKRTGDEAQDQQGAIDLAKDPKENAEHIMLVDLARNDLGRHSTKVEVKELKKIHFYSHVIHLVSKVDGHLPKDANPIQIFGDTFPAGTLSGAPKYKAIQLINKYENQNRAFYGGAIGFIGFDGDMNQAIVIRSFMSTNNTLHYQAGAGIVMDSVPESELQEVNNKLGALTKALKEAEKIA